MKQRSEENACVIHSLSSFLLSHGEKHKLKNEMKHAFLVFICSFTLFFSSTAHCHYHLAVEPKARM